MSNLSNIHTSACISPLSLQSISKHYIRWASLALPDGKMYTSFFNSLYFCPKSRYSFHSNVHATLNLPNHYNYVPFESVKHRFHPFLADETWSFREHSHKHHCTRLIRGVSQNSHSYWPMACHCQPHKLFIRLMPKCFNILGSYCLFLYLSLSLSLFIISPT